MYWTLSLTGRMWPVRAILYDAYGYQTVVEPGQDGILGFGSDDVYLPGRVAACPTHSRFSNGWDPRILITALDAG